MVRFYTLNFEAHQNFTKEIQAARLADGMQNQA